MEYLKKSTWFFLRLITRSKINLIFLSGLIVACATTASQDVIIFSHNLHSEQGLDCSDCHANIVQDAEQKIEPMSMDKCGDCHDVEDEEGCKVCHTNAEESDGWQKPTPAPLKFSHQTHKKRQPDVMTDCASCHAGAATATTTATRTQLLPHHEECASCHKKDISLGRCDLCHDRLDLYDMVENDYYRHAPGFMARHGLEASAAEANCSQCHEQSFCADCHNKNSTIRPSLKFPDKVDRTFMHSGDWMSKHPIESRAKPASCLKCHGVSYCSACHNRTGVGAGIDQGGTNSPHPGDTEWINAGPGSHGAEARKDILRCASCHDQGAASNCVNCHREAMGINPHPPGWKSTVPSSESNTHPTCRICHN
ncbi:MAG: hypothetical protein JXX14_13295 [Deltaproteobacteria bacterium]|nr:hypothetical protein [Deltaproteobacteria bacterium]